MCYSLVELRSNTVQHDIDNVVICYLGIDIESVNIIYILLCSTCLARISNLIRRPIWLLVLLIVFSDVILDLFSGSTPVPVSCPPFLHFISYAKTNVSKFLLLVAGLYDSEVIIYLKNPFFQILYLLSCRWYCLSCYHIQRIASLLLRGH